MSIRQLNASYVDEEDRVMFRFTTAAQEEYRLWLTRAVMGQLMLQLKDVAVQVLVQRGQVKAARAVADFKQQALAQNAEYTQFVAAPRLPLGAEPVRVRSAQVRVAQGKSSLELALTAGRQLTLSLDDDLSGKLLLLMQRMNQTARWSLPLDASDAVAKPATHEGALADAAVPKVLH